jgi:hypothetical protein
MPLSGHIDEERPPNFGGLLQYRVKLLHRWLTPLVSSS